jgi:hypothetical protein
VDPCALLLPPLLASSCPVLPGKHVCLAVASPQTRCAHTLHQRACTPRSQRIDKLDTEPLCHTPPFLAVGALYRCGFFIRLQTTKTHTASFSEKERPARTLRSFHLQAVRVFRRCWWSTRRLASLNSHAYAIIYTSI